MCVVCLGDGGAVVPQDITWHKEHLCKFGVPGLSARISSVVLRKYLENP